MTVVQDGCNLFISTYHDNNTTMRWDLVETCGILLCELLVHVVTFISVALKEKEAVTLRLGVRMSFKIHRREKHSKFFTDSVSEDRGIKSLPRPH